MARSLSLRVGLIICLLLPVIYATGVEVGGGVELEAPFRSEAFLCSKKVEPPEVVRPGLVECSVNGAHLTIDRPSPSIELESIVEKVGKDWHVTSNRSEQWNDRQTLNSHVFWDYVRDSAKKYAMIRRLKSAEVFELMPRILTQRSYYKTQATKQEKKLIDESWEKLFAQWWPTTDADGSRREERARAERIMKMLDEIAEQVGLKQQQGKTDEEKKLMGSRYARAIADNLTKEAWILFHPLKPKNSWLINGLISTSQDVHSSLNQLADDLKRFPDGFFHNGVRDKKIPQSSALEVKISESRITQTA
ncbi:hypothetical protein PTTG_25295 [Puccinia triticina 1-1 BBBD Race 1]|uniref:Uncharacterized protein n=2 Tax=Puccinia triticina TaxID=208348 RepID=A0A180H5S9_PUCT1|nr:uncharacterized protein PtA15_2A602 [Puccinia triticina]OAV99793.1 hypothetical protein PTTG_25295 [Puccinia triticina 1-1 BBBD Race 1]WAQ82285.1 hypothetical protein PtA15_2A602 [Puccinia triticina]WAR53139.1 hypothetical protein PtB15_2B570 [Puccinia triticina]